MIHDLSMNIICKPNPFDRTSDAQSFWTRIFIIMSHFMRPFPLSVLSAPIMTTGGAIKATGDSLSYETMRESLTIQLTTSPQTLTSAQILNIDEHIVLNIAFHCEHCSRPLTSQPRSGANKLEQFATRLASTYSHSFTLFSHLIPNLFYALFN